MPVVLVLARTGDGRIVYTRRSDWPEGAWGLVSGFVEVGETAESAAVREVGEETGIAAREPRIVRTVASGDLLLICVVVEIEDAVPRVASDVDEVTLRKPDLALTPPNWEARRFIEDQFRG
jgi:NADH pyrophosphatase NudC (nudix superfamily)